jgi:hypothetical protein
MSGSRGAQNPARATPRVSKAKTASPPSGEQSRERFPVARLMSRCGTVPVQVRVSTQRACSCFAPTPSSRRLKTQRSLVQVPPRQQPKTSRGSRLHKGRSQSWPASPEGLSPKAALSQLRQERWAPDVADWATRPALGTRGGRASIPASPRPPAAPSARCRNVARCRAAARGPRAREAD